MLPDRWTPGSSPGVTVVAVSASVQPPRFLRQHDRDAVADRISELGGARDQLLLLGVVLQRALGQRAHQDFEQLRIDGAGGAFDGRSVHDAVPEFVPPLYHNASRIWTHPSPLATLVGVQPNSNREMAEQRIDLLP